jgi:GMP synthase-like glutamine amidotransferase
MASPAPKERGEERLSGGVIMRAHYLQHLPFEGLGSIGPWLAAARAEVTRTRLYAGDPLPEVGALDLLVVMGGPAGGADGGAMPWVAAEKELIRRVIDASVPVLGVCRGAQLIASALGARVHRNREKEIGWFPVSPVANGPGNGSAFRFPRALEVFHWHEEAFDLPAGAKHLARSSGCEHQAFQVGRSVIGLQFHLEATPGSAHAFVTHCRDELIPSPQVQCEREILQWQPMRYAVSNAVMGEVLSYLVGVRP